MPTPTSPSSPDSNGASLPGAPPDVPSRWRGVPAAERQAERRRLLVEAATELLGTAGIAGTTVRGVCEASKLNPRYFYESFPDLDSLIVAVYDEVATAAFTTMVDAVAALAATAGAGTVDHREITRCTIGSFVRHVTSDPRRARVLFLEGLGNESLARRRFESMHNLARMIEQDAAAELRSGELDSAVKVGANIVVGGMTELMIAWLHGTLDVSIDRLIDDAAELFIALGRTAGSMATRRGSG